MNIGSVTFDTFFKGKEIVSIKALNGDYLVGPEQGTKFVFSALTFDNNLVITKTKKFVSTGDEYKTEIWLPLSVVAVVEIEIEKE